MNPILRPLPLLGRILIALVFVFAGISKIGNPAGTVGIMARHGIPLPNLLVYGAIVVELVSGLMLIAGLYARLVAAVLFLYTLLLAMIFHPYWAVPSAQAALQQAIFFEHLSMMGGMLVVAAFGAGPLSLDAWRRRGIEERDVGLAHSGDRPIGRTR